MVAAHALDADLALRRRVSVYLDGWSISLPSRPRVCDASRPVQLAAPRGRAVASGAALCNADVDEVRRRPRGHYESRRVLGTRGQVRRAASSAALTAAVTLVRGDKGVAPR